MTVLSWGGPFVPRLEAFVSPLGAELGHNETQTDLQDVLHTLFQHDIPITRLEEFIAPFSFPLLVDVSDPRDDLQTFLIFLNQQPPAPLMGFSSGAAADLDPEAIADLMWLAVHQPAMALARSRTRPTRTPTRHKQKSDGAQSQMATDQASSDSASLPSTSALATGSMVNEPVQAPPSLEAQLLPQASVPGSERLPVWVNDPLDLIDPQELYEAVLPLMQPVATDQAAALDESATLDHFVQWRQLIPVWQPDQRYRFSLRLILDQGFSMSVWQPLLEHISDRLRGFHGFKEIEVLPWLPESLRHPGSEDSTLNQPQLSPSFSQTGGVDQLTVVISDCAGLQWWGPPGASHGAAFGLLRSLGAAQPLVIWQVLPSWMWSRTALGQGEAVTLRRSSVGASWPFQLVRSRGGLLPAAMEAPSPLPVFELTPEGLRTWGLLMVGSPFLASPGILPPHDEPSAASTPAEGRERQSQEEEGDPLMSLRRFQHLASLDARRLMALLAAAPVLTLPVMRLIQAALLETTGTAALAEVVLSGLLRPVDRRQGRDPEAVQFTFAPPVREALLRQQPPSLTLQVIEEVTDFIAAHWSRKGWGSFRAFLTDPSIAAPPGQERSQHFAMLAADIIAALGGAYATFAERLRIAQRKDPFPRNLFRFEPVETETAQLLRAPSPESVAFTTVTELVIEPWSQSFQYDTPQGDRKTGIALGFREQLSREGISLPMIHISAGTFQMGSPPDEEGRYDEEGPQHEVTLEAFFLSRTPITQAQWRAVAEWEPGPEEDPWPRKLDPDPVKTLSDSQRFFGEQRPVVNVSWEDAMEFCHRLRVRTGKNYILPSEAQWEYACRAGTNTPFHFGETISTEVANYDGRSIYGSEKAEKEAVTEQSQEEEPRTGTGDQSQIRNIYREQPTDVGIFPANVWGLHDMHGNVWEWCHDHWHDNYQGAPVDGSPWIDETTIKSKSRLLRGGSWGSDPGNCRSACRDRNLPDDRGDNIGFRVCCLPQDLILYP